MSIQDNKMQCEDSKLAFKLRPYPIDLTYLLQLSHYAFDIDGVPYGSTIGYHPITIAQYALIHWNLYLVSGIDHHLNTFLKQANWFIEHESHIGNDAGGWPISLPHPDFHTEGPWLSAFAQGSSISVLVRAYELTREEVFLEVAHRAVRTFERDILDGGVSAPAGDEGSFFEEVGVYPAAHILSGFIYALFGLYDYVALTGNSQIEKLIQNSHATMHKLLEEFDVGFWTNTDLLQRRLATPSQLALQVKLLEELTRYNGCADCLIKASCWKSYQYRWRSRLRYEGTRCFRAFGRFLWKRIQTSLFPKVQLTHVPLLRVCVALDGFPVIGGVLTILERMAQVTADIWQIEFLARHSPFGLHREHYIIHRFGAKMTSPRYFPFAWLYFLLGFWKLLSLLHHGANYHVILPQSGTFTGAFAALAARLAGVRVVCFDHGELNLLIGRNGEIHRAERIKELENKKVPWAARLLARQLLLLYWPSHYLSARITARLVDQYLIPGVRGDGLDDLCKGFGVYPSRITRFANMIDLDRHIIPDAALRANRREKLGIAADAIVIAIVCRLAPEKGLEIAFQAISQGLSALSLERRTRVRIILAGDGPLRKQIEEDVHARGLKQICLLYGEASPEEVIMLLSLGDIFLYTSLRGAGYPLAILEAMASGCAVIASTEPLANAYMLAEGRGIAVPAGDIMQTTMALVRLLNDLELCRRMGNLAREYVATHHSPAMFKRTLMRATYWSALDQFLDFGKELETSASEREGRR